MNMLVTILFILGMISLIDKMFQLNLGLASYFDQGMNSMGSLLISICGWYVILIPLITNNQQILYDFFKFLPFDFSILIGCTLSNVLGGYHIVEAYTNQSSIIIFSGICLASTLGAFFSFQLPIFLNGIKEDFDHLMYGFTIGIITLPLTFIPLLLILNLSFIHIIPLLILCVILFLGITFKQDLTLKIMMLFAKCIQFLTFLLFFLVIVQFFMYPNYLDLSLLKDSCITVLKMCLTISGSFVLAHLLIKYCRSFLEKMSSLLNTNIETMIGILLSLASSVSMIPFYSKMNETGKKMNAAFSVAGAYSLGGQLAFVSSTTPQYIHYFLIVKVVAGIISILVVYLLTRKEVKS